VALLVVWRQVELHEDAGDVLLDRAGGDHQRLGDAGVGPALRHEAEHLAFLGGEPGQRVGVPAAGEQLPYDLGVECGSARGDAPGRLDELVDVGDAVLEQVADGPGVAGEQFGRVPLLDEL